MNRGEIQAMYAGYADEKLMEMRERNLREWKDDFASLSLENTIVDEMTRRGLLRPDIYDASWKVANALRKDIAPREDMEKVRAILENFLQDAIAYGKRNSE